jgi:hypothetical protein
MPEQSSASSQRGSRGNDGEMIAPRRNGELAGLPRQSAGRPPGVVPAYPFDPPVAALGPLFQRRLERIHVCRVRFSVEVNSRPTERVLGGYYRSRRLVRIYSHDRAEGRRPIEELFDTFLHEVAHHLEYTEPFTFGSRTCRRVPGLMHSRLFWRILGELRLRWANQNTQRADL